MFVRVTALTILAVFAAVPTQSQERFSLFVPSSPESVERMLTIAGLRDDDVVVDLGSGNGLIPLTAARMNPRLRGRGSTSIPSSWSNPTNAPGPKGSRTGFVSSIATRSTWTLVRQPS